MNQNLIKTFQERGYFNQCTDLDNLTKLLNNKKIKKNEEIFELFLD